MAAQSAINPSETTYVKGANVMGFWGRFLGMELPDENEINRVVVINQTDLYETRMANGFSFGGEPGDGRVFFREETVPSGTQFTFSVTYNDGREKIIKAMNGSILCDKLLKMAYDTYDNTDTDKKQKPDKNTAQVSPKKGKKEPNNEEPPAQNIALLTVGTYVVGEDIPAGKFDFHAVSGSGIWTHKRNEKILKSELIGDDYETKDIRNVRLENGDVIEISSSVRIRMLKSKPITIDNIE